MSKADLMDNFTRTLSARVREEQRAQFFEALGAHVKCIAAMEVPQVSQGIVPFETFRALLICTHLDTLAKARLGGKSSGARRARRNESRASPRPILPPELAHSTGPGTSSSKWQPAK